MILFRLCFSDLNDSGVGDEVRAAFGCFDKEDHGYISISGKQIFIFIDT